MTYPSWPGVTTVMLPDVTKLRQLSHVDWLEGASSVASSVHVHAGPVSGRDCDCLDRVGLDRWWMNQEYFLTCRTLVTGVSIMSCICQACLPPATWSQNMPLLREASCIKPHLAAHQSIHACVSSVCIQITAECQRPVQTVGAMPAACAL